MPKLQAKKIITYLLVSGIFVWFFEAGIHFITVPDGSFYESLLDISIHELYTRLIIWTIVTLLLVVYSRNKIIQENNAHIENIFNNVIPICITNLNYEIIKANNSYWSIWGKNSDRPIKCYEQRPGKVCHTENCALTQVMNGAKKYVYESQKKINGENYHFLITATPYLDSHKRITGVIESFQDITARKKLEDEKEQLITKLKDSLEKVKLLSGFIPICASCKKIRDDKGFWNQVEAYIADHSEARFSHSICPDCAKKLYPEINLTNKKQEKGTT